MSEWVDTSVDEMTGEHDTEQSLLQAAGPRLIHTLFSASKNVLVYDLSNRAAKRSIHEFMAPLQALLDEEGRVTLRVSNDFLLVNGERVAVGAQTAATQTHLTEEMEKRDVEEIEFLAGIDEFEAGWFLRTFFGEQPDDDTYARLQERITEHGCQHVTIAQWVERERHLNDVSDDDKKEVREESNRVFFRTVALVREVLQGIEQRRAIQVRKAERLTQQMADIIKQDESILVGLSSIKNFDEYTFAHSVNVCILSMLMADRLRLYKSDIARLGVAALLHDIGKTYVPQTILNKPGRLGDRDWELMKYHTFFGVTELTRIKNLHEVSDALFVALQHHVHYNMQGYPQKPGGWNLRLFTRIVTIADYFDAMTTPRIYNKKAVTPDRALSFILSKSGQIFDPFIAKVFIRAMGIYPVGTVVELDTGECGVVVRQKDESRYMHRPYVILLQDGRAAMQDDAIDLTERNAQGRYRRSIVRTVYEDALELDKARAFTTEK